MNTCTKAPETIYTKEDLIRNDYGDWQTSYDFAKEVCLYLKKKGITPEVIVEPTCGLGNFIAAAIDVFNSIEEVYAVEICQEYISKTDGKLKQYKRAKKIIDYTTLMYLLLILRTLLIRIRRKRYWSWEIHHG